MNDSGEDQEPEAERSEYGKWESTASIMRKRAEDLK